MESAILRAPRSSFEFPYRSVHSEPDHFDIENIVVDEPNFISTIDASQVVQLENSCYFV